MIPALLLTIGLDAIGERLAPSVYDSASPGHPGATPWVIVSNSLLFCNQVWFDFQSMARTRHFGLSPSTFGTTSSLGFSSLLGGRSAT